LRYMERNTRTTNDTARMSGIVVHCIGVELSATEFTYLCDSTLSPKQLNRLLISWSHGPESTFWKDYCGVYLIIS